MFFIVPYKISLNGIIDESLAYYQPDRQNSDGHMTWTVVASLGLLYFFKEKIIIITAKKKS